MSEELFTCMMCHNKFPSEELTTLSGSSYFCDLCANLAQALIDDPNWPAQEDEHD